MAAIIRGNKIKPLRISMDFIADFFHLRKEMFPFIFSQPRQNSWHVYYVIPEREYCA